MSAVAAPPSMTLSPWASASPYPSIHLSSYLERNARLRPAAVALVDAGTGAQHSFADVWRGASRVGRRLQDDGVRRGDRVLIDAPNSPEWLVAFHGVLLAGATVTTMNPLYREREIAEQLDDCEPVAAFTSKETHEIVGDVVAGAPRGPGRTTRRYRLEDVWAVADQAPGNHLPIAIDPFDDLAVLPYSSGTTGGPKGVMLTHANLVSNVRQVLATGISTAYSVFVDFLPFFHIYGMTLLANHGLAAGGTQVVMRAFDLGQFVELVARYRATHLFVVPPALLGLSHLSDPQVFDTSSVRLVISGAAPLPVDLGRRVAAQFRLPLVQGYGMTEASPVTHLSMLGRDKPGTVGPPLPDTRQLVVDPSGAPLDPEEVGELLIEGPQVMKGYWNRPEATAAAIIERPEPRQQQAEPWTGRWLKTGDIVSVDDEGYATIRDRAKEMIKYRGYQIAPAELEAILVEHPGLLDAAVVPKPAEPGVGEVPKAFVVARQGAQVTADSVAGFLEERVAPYKKVREVEFVEAIPRTPSGKILRRDLIARERAKQEGRDRAEPE